MINIIFQFLDACLKNSKGVLKYHVTHTTVKNKLTQNGQNISLNSDGLQNQRAMQEDLHIEVFKIA